MPKVVPAPIDVKADELASMLEEYARERASARDIYGVHWLVGKSMSVRNLGRSVRNRFGGESVEDY